VLAGRRHRYDDLRETERACDEVVSLPCFPELTDDEVERVIDAVLRST
jgi:dTDP-4-amino-4,6-dideoxygalactose transaminase